MIVTAEIDEWPDYDLDEYDVDYKFLKKMFDVANLKINDWPQNETEKEFRRKVYAMERRINIIQRECKTLSKAYKTDAVN